MASAMGQGEELMAGPMLPASSPDVVVPRGRVSLGRGWRGRSSLRDRECSGGKSVRSGPQVGGERWDWGSVSSCG